MICGNCFNQMPIEHGFCSACGFDNHKNQLEYPMALPAGSILYGRYIVGKVLGQGGFGITYKAKDYRSGEPVAIKEFFPGSMATRSGTTVVPYSGAQGENFEYGKTTFLEEAKTMAEFNSNPNIAAVQVYFEENGTAYYVMEYLDGCHLGRYIAEHDGHLSWMDTMRIMLPVVDVLDQIHEKGVIHRDVSPDNIFITTGGTVKLLDFGAARHSLGNVSQSLDVVIKHGFAPREQYSRRGRQGPYTDIYAACATIYFALTGVKPDESIDRAEDDTLPSPKSIGAKITKTLDEVIMKGLAVDAKDRYQSAADLHFALTGGDGSQPTESLEYTEPQKTSLFFKNLAAQLRKVGNKLRNIRDWDFFSKGSAEQLKARQRFMILLIVGLLFLGYGLFRLVHNHQYSPWEVKKEPTCQIEGKMIRKCFCGHRESILLDTKSHTLVPDAGYAATCTAQGLSDGSHCSVCGKTIKEQLVIPKLSHDLGALPVVDATCTRSGTSGGYGCKNCDYIQTPQTTIQPLGHSFSDNICIRCDAKEWWVEFSTTKTEFTLGEQIEIAYTIRTNEGFKSSGSAGTKPSTKLYSTTYFEYENGQTSLTDKKYLNSGEPVSANSSWFTTWKNGISNKATVTYRFYNEDDCLLGTYTFYVK